MTKRHYHHGDLRNALVDAAVGLAREGGPPAIVLREAARRVGVSPNAAYRHFDALPDLIEAVAQDSRTTLARSMRAELARLVETGDEGRDAVEAMNAVGRGYVRFALTEPGLFASAFLCEMPATIDHDADSPAFLLEQALDRLFAAGLLAAADRPFAFATAWAGVHGLSTLLLGPLAPLPPDERDALIESTLDHIGRGLIIRR